MSSCCAFLPADPDDAIAVICNVLRAGLRDEFEVTTGHGRRAVSSAEIARRTTQQLRRLQSTGVLPTDDPDFIVFEELCVAGPEGSTVDVIAHIAPATALLLRVNHGRADALTYHLPKVRSSYARLYDPDSVVGLAHDAVVNSLVSAFRTRHRGSIDALTAALGRTCADAQAPDLIPASDEAELTEGRRILDALARQRASTGT